MNQRDTQLLELRPQISAAQPELAVNPVEAFQHATLRPVLKLQNDLLVDAFVQYTHKRKGVFQKLDATKREAYIEQALQKDQRLREWCFGLIAGQFTIEEWDFFREHQSDLRKRLTTLLVQRLVDQLVGGNV